MSAAWQTLKDECARWRDAGRSPELWWRDDDAGAPDAALERLLKLSAASAVPLALAVVPARAEAALFDRLGDSVEVLQHGTDHRDRAAGGEKKTEFPVAEPATDALARLRSGWERLHALGGQRCLPVLAPPWNRLPEQLLPQLATAGYRGLSRYGAPGAPVHRLRQVNTHVDIIAWRKDRAFIGEAAALQGLARHLAARRVDAAEAPDTTGLLTHHAVHDEVAWRFLEQLLETTRAIEGLRWRSAQELFHV